MDAKICGRFFLVISNNVGFFIGFVIYMSWLLPMQSVEVGVPPSNAPRTWNQNTFDLNYDNCKFPFYHRLSNTTYTNGTQVYQYLRPWIGQDLSGGRTSCILLLDQFCGCGYPSMQNDGFGPWPFNQPDFVDDDGITLTTYGPFTTHMQTTVTLCVVIFAVINMYVINIWCVPHGPGASSSTKRKQMIQQNWQAYLATVSGHLASFIAIWITFKMLVETQPLGTCVPKTCSWDGIQWSSVDPMVYYRDTITGHCVRPADVDVLEAFVDACPDALVFDDRTNTNDGIWIYATLVLSDQLTETDSNFKNNILTNFIYVWFTIVLVLDLIALLFFSCRITWYWQSHCDCKDKDENETSEAQAQAPHAHYICCSYGVPSVLPDDDVQTLHAPILVPTTDGKQQVYPQENASSSSSTTHVINSVSS
jgi:hypothetical protein